MLILSWDSLLLIVRFAIRTAILFPGQGAQSVGMAKELCAKSTVARSLFDEASQTLGYDLLQLCAEGPADRLNATDVSQPAIFVASLAGLEQLQHDQPDVIEAVTDTAGLSLGEYTALVFAGAMSFTDGLQVVQARGQAMQAAAEATPSGMVSVIGVTAPEVDVLVAQAQTEGVIRVANLLCPGNTVVSGSDAALDKFCTLAESHGVRTIKLSVAGAFHTELMKPADERLAEALQTVTLQSPRIPVWSNVDAEAHTDPEEIRSLLIRQVLSPVLWEATMSKLLAAGVEQFYEVGPGRVLAGLMKRIQRKTPFENVTV